METRSSPPLLLLPLDQAPSSWRKSTPKLEDLKSAKKHGRARAGNGRMAYDNENRMLQWPTESDRMDEEIFFVRQNWNWADQSDSSFCLTKLSARNCVGMIANNEALT